MKTKDKITSRFFIDVEFECLKEYYPNPKFEYTWNNPIIASYLAHNICRNLLLDFKKMIDLMDTSSNLIRGHNSLIWENVKKSLSQRIIILDFTVFLEGSIEDSFLKITNKRKRINNLTNINEIIDFFDDTYKDYFSNTEIIKKVDRFLKDKVIGVGKVLNDKTLLDGGMSNNTLVKKAYRVPCQYPPCEGRGFTGIGEKSKSGYDYISDILLKIRSCKIIGVMREIYINELFTMVNRVSGLMFSASRLISYINLYNLKGEVDTARNPNLRIFPLRKYFGRTNIPCIQGLVKLDTIYWKYEREKKRRIHKLYQYRFHHRMIERKGEYLGPW